MKRRGMIYFLLLAAVLCLTLVFKSFLDGLAAAGSLSDSAVESDQFRKQEISAESFAKIREFAEEQGEDLWEVMSVFMAAGRFSLEDPGEIKTENYQRYRSALKRWRPGAFSAVQKAYRAVWSDVECMPVRDAGRGLTEISFEDGWMDARGEKAERSHEGTDIFCREEDKETQAASGVYPVVSMTDGYVEKVGWLTLGGNRIGIRSDSGGYFYYAHLSDYARDFQIGERVRAGELLGFMGDTGYGPQGTSGRFPVHLHLGIYFDTEEGKEISVNPYPLLRVLDIT